MIDPKCIIHACPTWWALNPQQGPDGSLVQSLRLRIIWQERSSHNGHYVALKVQCLAESSGLKIPGVYAGGRTYLHPKNRLDNSQLQRKSDFLPLGSGIAAHRCGWVSDRNSAVFLLTPPLILQKHRFMPNRVIQMPEVAKNPLTFSPQWAFGGKVQTKNQSIIYPWNPHGRGFYLRGSQESSKTSKRNLKSPTEIELPRIYPGQTNSSPNHHLRKSDLYKGWSPNQMPGKEWVPSPLLSQADNIETESIDEKSLCWQFMGFHPQHAVQKFMMPQIIIPDFRLHRLDFRGFPPVMDLTYSRTFALENAQDYSIQCSQLLQENQDVKVSFYPRQGL